MIQHRDNLIMRFCDLSDKLLECVEYIPDRDLESIVQEMDMVLEHAERHIDGEM